MTTNLDLSVIIPAYNEAKNLQQKKLNEVYDYLKTSKQNFELILVNDGSTDDTLKLLCEFAKNKEELVVLDEPHRGKAGTVIAGMKRAKGKVRLFSDLDQSTPLGEFEKMQPFFNKGYDVVIGSREVEGSLRAKEPWYRHLMGKGFNLAVQLLTIRGIHDTLCGFKAFSDQAATRLFPKLIATTKPTQDAFTGAFDVEVLYLAKKFGFRVAEVPVQWFHVKTDRVNPIKDSLRMFVQLWQIKLMDLIGKYR